MRNALALSALAVLLPATGEVQLRDVFVAFAGFGIRSPAINSASFRLSAGGSSSKQEDGSPAVFKPLVLEMDGFRCAWQAANLGQFVSIRNYWRGCVCADLALYIVVRGGCSGAAVSGHPFSILFLRPATANTQHCLREGGAQLRPQSACRRSCASRVHAGSLVLRRFVKLCREAGLFDDNFTSTGADIIFTKVKTKVSPSGLRVSVVS